MTVVLVVGGAGYIGSHACKALAERGDVPVTFDNLSSGHERAVQWGPLVRGDVRSAVDLNAAFLVHAPDAVMHFAGDIEVAQGERSPLRFWDNNVGGVISLLAAMERAGVRPLVFSSTCAVYGSPAMSPLTEEQPCAPTSVYGRTKRAAELLLADAARGRTLRYAALRYFNAAGASASAEIGEEHEPETHLIPNALKAAAGLGPPMALFGTDYDTPDGTCIRDYVHVSDLADAHLLALDTLLSGAREIIANLGAGRKASVLQVLDAVGRVTGSPPPYTVRPRRPGDAPVLYAGIDQARSVLGFEPKRSHLDQIVEDAWRFHRRRWAARQALG